ncbi:MAG TPA: HemK/PrmC family methyltransferase [Acidobacteriaceae bacterium]|jgi:release factor glutamine methyltransferase
MTLRDALLEASTRISRRDAETLLAQILRRDRAWLLAHMDDELAPPDHDALRALTSRRTAGEPLQHLTGTQQFFGLDLHVTRDVLIPRPETEHLVEAVLEHLRDRPAEQLRITDVGTGSGAIAIALASVLDHASITAIDLSPAALAIARANAEQHGLSDRIRFLEGDLLEPVLANRAPADPFLTGDPLASVVTGIALLPADPLTDPEAGVHSPRWKAAEAPFDAIVSNPPYVALTEKDSLAPEVRDHEPELALYAGPDGLEIYRRLIPQAFAALRPGGVLAVEMGFGQREALAELLAGWDGVYFLDDYAGIPRVALAFRP